MKKSVNYIPRYLIINQYIILCETDRKYLLMMSIIPPETPCEIQRRTLLQHAYSELTHNTIYKSEYPASSGTNRMVVRSMALIETTDNIFTNVFEMINMHEQDQKKIIHRSDENTILFGSETVAKLNTYVLESLNGLITNNDIDNIRSFVNDNPYIIDTIRQHYSSDLIYRQPIILLIYYLIIINNTHLSVCGHYQKHIFGQCLLIADSMPN